MSLAVHRYRSAANRGLWQRGSCVNNPMAYAERCGAGRLPLLERVGEVGRAAACGGCTHAIEHEGENGSFGFVAFLAVSGGASIEQPRMRCCAQ